MMSSPTIDQSTLKDVYDVDKHTITPGMTIKVPLYPDIALQRLIIPKGLVTDQK